MLQALCPYRVLKLSSMCHIPILMCLSLSLSLSLCPFPFLTLSHSLACVQMLEAISMKPVKGLFRAECQLMKQAQTLVCVGESVHQTRCRCRCRCHC